MAPTDRMTGADQPMLAAIRARDAALHTMGNLTLVTVPGNTSASNWAFPDKKPWLRQSLLALHLAILEKDVWDEASISHRAKSLADMAVKVWPGPSC